MPYMEFSEKDILLQKPSLDLIRLTKSHLSDITHEDISHLIHGFMESLDDDLDSPTALAKLEKICTEVKNGKDLSQIDFDRLVNILGMYP